MGFLDKLKKASVTIATGGMNKVVANKTVSKVAAKVTDPIGRRTTAVAKALRVPSIAAQMNIKKAITNPKAYLTDMASAYGKDLGFAKEVYGHFKAGDFKGLVKQGVADTKNALRAAKTGKAVSIENSLSAPPPVQPARDTPSESQLTGDFLPPPYYDSNPYPVDDGGTRSEKSPVGLLIVAGIGVAVILVVALR